MNICQSLTLIPFLTIVGLDMIIFHVVQCYKSLNNLREEIGLDGLQVIGIMYGVWLLLENISNII